MGDLMGVFWQGERRAGGVPNVWFSLQGAREGGRLGSLMARSLLQGKQCRTSTNSVAWEAQGPAGVALRQTGLFRMGIDLLELGFWV